MTDIVSALPSALGRWPSYLSSQSPWHGLIPAAYWLTSIFKPKRILELGVYRGDSLFALYDGAREFELESIVGIDHWEGDEHTGAYGGGPYAQVRAQLAQTSDNRITLVKDSFSSGLQGVTDGSIDMIHIDGAHDYESVKRDFYEALPKLSQDGVVLMHDTCVHRPDFGVDTFWAELREEHPDSSLELAFSNGLGILQPHDSGRSFFAKAFGDTDKVNLCVDALRLRGYHIRQAVDAEHETLLRYHLETTEWVYGRTFPAEFSLRNIVTQTGVLAAETATGKTQDDYKPFSDDVRGALDFHMGGSLRDIVSAELLKYTESSASEVDSKVSDALESRIDDISEKARLKLGAELSDLISPELPSTMDELTESIRFEVAKALDTLGNDLYEKIKPKILEEIQWAQKSLESDPKDEEA